MLIVLNRFRTISYHTKLIILIYGICLASRAINWGIVTLRNVPQLFRFIVCLPNVTSEKAKLISGLLNIRRYFRAVGSAHPISASAIFDSDLVGFLHVKVSPLTAFWLSRCFEYSHSSNENQIGRHRSTAFTAFTNKCCGIYGLVWRSPKKRSQVWCSEQHTRGKDRLSNPLIEDHLPKLVGWLCWLQAFGYCGTARGDMEDRREMKG
jgi:hypothetical protein